MKKTFLFSCVAFAALLFEGCIGETPNPQPPEPVITNAKYIYVLNEGLWHSNNASITRFDIENQTNTLDWFLTVNGKGLGDTGNDMKIYGSKMYIVVNESSQLEVTDLSGKSIRQIPLFSRISLSDSIARKPRNIAFYQNKAYVCCSYDGSVARIDTATLAVDAYAAAGSNPEDLCVANGKLYVSNSGGLSGASGGPYGTTVSVFDLNTFQQVKTITVTTNPTVMKVGPDGMIYLLSAGNYADIAPDIQRIDPAKDVVDKVLDNSAATDFTFYNNNLYLCYYDSFSNSTAVKVIDLKNYSSKDFITDGTTLGNVMGITADAATGDIYIATAASDYVSNGNVTCFDSTGKRKFSFSAGVNPYKIAFVR